MILLENISKIYHTGEVETNALKDINFEIKEKEFLVILGPSGSGKSTMLNVISGLDEPSSGTIKVDQEVITSMKEKELTKFRRDQLGFVFQSYNLFQMLSVKENVAIAAHISADPLDVDEMLDHVGMLPQKDKFPSQLSGGEQQRVSIARAVVKKPRILFCDEPTGALDEESSREVLNVIEKLNKDFGTTVVMITHNSNIGAMGDRVIKMNSGEIVDIIENSKRKSAYEIDWS